MLQVLAVSRQGDQAGSKHFGRFAATGAEHPTLLFKVAGQEPLLVVSGFPLRWSRHVWGRRGRERGETRRGLLGHG